MSTPRDFIPIRLRHVDARYGRKVIREIKAAELLRGVKRKRGRYVWAGPAAETAIANAYNRCKDHKHSAWMADTLRYDLALGTDHGVVRCEVKTRIAKQGWVHPERFDWISVPLHEDREPIKPEADVIVFCWWSADAPRVLWVLGRLLGVKDFLERATFYKHEALLPRGGWVQGKGTYQLHVSELPRFPRGLLKELKDDEAYPDHSDLR